MLIFLNLSSCTACEQGRVIVHLSSGTCMCCSFARWVDDYGVADAGDDATKSNYASIPAPGSADRRQSLSRLAPVVEEPGASASVDASSDILGSWRNASTRPMQSSAEWLHRQARCGISQSTSKQSGQRCALHSCFLRYCMWVCCTQACPCEMHSCDCFYSIHWVALVQPKGEQQWQHGPSKPIKAEQDALVQHRQRFIGYAFDTVCLSAMSMQLAEHQLCRSQNLGSLQICMQGTSKHADTLTIIMMHSQLIRRTLASLRNVKALPSPSDTACRGTARAQTRQSTKTHS